MTDQPPDGQDVPQPQQPAQPPSQPPRPPQQLPQQPSWGSPPGTSPGTPPGQWPAQPPHQAGQPYQPGQPQHLPPPYGAYGPPQGAPPLQTGLPNWAKVVLGALIGLVASVGSPLIAFGVAGLDAPVELLVLLVTVIPPLLATPLLIARSTRAWGVGVMLGLAVGSFILGGACVSLISGY
ncbi:hypothetical protein LL946_06430 [Knoellia locipacati]|uniref:hypothetical protein n=1 Tax=Knoellia locipacati TaxID=882824 RepID=UPI00384C4136